MPRPFRVESLAGSLKKCGGFVNDHDYIAKCRPADIRSALKYIDRLESLNAELLAACKAGLSLLENTTLTTWDLDVLTEMRAAIVKAESEGE